MGKPFDLFGIGRGRLIAQFDWDPAGCVQTVIPEIVHLCLYDKIFIKTHSYDHSFPLRFKAPKWNEIQVPLAPAPVNGFEYVHHCVQM